MGYVVDLAGAMVLGLGFGEALIVACWALDRENRGRHDCGRRKWINQPEGGRTLADFMPRQARLVAECVPQARVNVQWSLEEV